MEARQSLNYKSMYCRNATAFFNGTIDATKYIAHDPLFYNSSFSIGTPCILICYASLIFTMTLGAGGKTLIDAYMRDPLLLSDVASMISTLQNLVDENKQEVLNEFFESICKTKNCLGWQRKLQKKLEELDKKEEERIKELRLTIVNVFVSLFEKETKTNNVVEDQILEIKKDIRSLKVEAIIDYLNSSHDSGKKLQHFMLEFLKPMMEEKKPQEAENMKVTI